MCFLPETQFRTKETHRMKVRKWKKFFHINRNQKEKKAGVAISISNYRRQRRILCSDQGIN